jgi:regulator of sirC expression with transglutaminase-like and TPR domain
MAGDGAGFTGQDEYQRNIEPFWWDLLEDELKRAQYDETVVLLDRRCAGLPQRADLRYFRGEARRLRAQAEDLPLARADFEAALALPNPPAQAHRSLGFLFRQQGDKAEALGAFGRYLQAAPDASDAGIIQSYLSELQT